MDQELPPQPNPTQPQTSQVSEGGLCDITDIETANKASQLYDTQKLIGLPVLYNINPVTKRSHRVHLYHKTLKEIVENDRYSVEVKTAAYKYFGRKFLNCEIPVAETGEPERPPSPARNPPETPQAGPSHEPTDAEMSAANTPPITPVKRVQGEPDDGSNKRTGRANEGSGVGIGSAEPATGMVGSVSPIPRPFVTTGPQSISFTKVHRIYTYGIDVGVFELDPYVPDPKIPVARTNKMHAMLTSLVNIPWDRPYFYLTPGEWHLIPKTAHVTKLQCQVVYRNTRQAFETNASTSNVATLNQYNDIIAAIGLNKKFDGLNVKINNLDLKTMRPAKLDFIEETDEVLLTKQFWGVAENDPDFAKTIPSSVLGKPVALNQFYAMITDSANNDSAGWPNLLQHVEFSDATTSVGQTVAQMAYKPKIAPLKTPPGSISRPYPGFTLDSNKTIDIDLPMFNKHMNTNALTIEVMRESPTGIKNLRSAPVETTNCGDEIFQYTDLIEKSQFVNFAHGDGPRPDSQPWIHVGIMASKAVSAKEIEAPTAKYSDVQAYFEVICKMDISYSFPNMYTHAQVYNVPSQEQLVRMTPVHKLSVKKTPVWGMYRKG